jgi:hypothetical protein
VTGNTATAPTFFFLSAIAGSGKTYVARALLAWATSEGLRSAAVATRGLAAQLLPDGTTAHRRLGLPVPLDRDSRSNIQTGSLRATELHHTRLLIWDEAVMAPSHAFDCAHRLFCELGCDPTDPISACPYLAVVRLSWPWVLCARSLWWCEVAPLRQFNITLLRSIPAARGMGVLLLEHNKRLSGLLRKATAMELQSARVPEAAE